MSRNHLALRSITVADSTLERFVAETLAADWACYTADADRAEYDRMYRVIAGFPQGFRLYFNERNEPIGYTGWYPIAVNIFDQLHDEPQTLTHRGDMMPLPHLSDNTNYIYIFNISIIEPLYKTAASRALIHDFAASINAIPNKKGLAAVTVSPHGERVMKKFGMIHRGEMMHDGVPEAVYAVRL